MSNILSRLWVWIKRLFCKKGVHPQLSKTLVFHGSILLDENAEPETIRANWIANVIKVDVGQYLVVPKDRHEWLWDVVLSRRVSMRLDTAATVYAISQVDGRDLEIYTLDDHGICDVPFAILDVEMQVIIRDNHD
jgi:hypothetical protein